MLHASPTKTLSQFDTDATGTWVGLTDHRPVIAACTGLFAKDMWQRLTDAYNQDRSINLSLFRCSVKQLTRMLNYAV